MVTMNKMLNDKKYYNLYIDGSWVESKSSKYIEVQNPATEEIVAYVTDANKEDVEKALISSEKAQLQWQKISPIKRAEYILKLIDKLKENKEHFAKLLVQEQGKTYKDALAEVDDTAAYMKYAAEYATQIRGDILPSPDEGIKLMIEKVPYGVTLGLCAWNYPLALVGRKLGPALVTGNTMIIKPHELTPMTTVEFMKLVDEVGFPRGVVNLITGNGPEVGSLLVQSPITKMITVTGSVKAGQAIYKGASQNISALSLELGGKAPFIVLEDADIDKAVDAAVVARYANCGQVCICCDMVFVHEKIAKTFTEKLLKKASEIKVGDPFDDKTEMGPKVSLADLEKIDGIVKRTVAQGGEIALGGERLKGGIYDKGFWYPPTVLTEVTPDMAAAEEEIFGPVLPIITISGFEEAVSICNASPYGLAAYLFTRDHSIIMGASQKLQVGTVFINTGITGYTHGYHNGHKLSGLGGEDGVYGLEAYMQKRTLYINTNI